MFKCPFPSFVLEWLDLLQVLGSAQAAVSYWVPRACHIHMTLLGHTLPPNYVTFRAKVRESFIAESHREAKLFTSWWPQSRKGREEHGVKRTKDKIKSLNASLQCPRAGPHLLKVHHSPKVVPQGRTKLSTLWCHIKQWHQQIKALCSCRNGGFTCFVQWESVFATWTWIHCNIYRTSQVATMS